MKGVKLKLNDYNNESGFALISLLIVLLILGVLVITSTSKRLDHSGSDVVENVQNGAVVVEHVQNDIAALESVMTEGHMLNSMDFEDFEEWPLVDSQLLVEAFESDSLYGKHGRITDNDLYDMYTDSGINLSEYHIIKDDILNRAYSSLDGTFYSNHRGHVLFVSNE